MLGNPRSPVTTEEWARRLAKSAELTPPQLPITPLIHFATQVTYFANGLSMHPRRVPTQHPILGIANRLNVIRFPPFAPS